MKSLLANRLITLGGPGSGPRPQGTAGTEGEHRSAADYHYGQQRILSKSNPALAAQHGEAGDAHSEAADQKQTHGEPAGWGKSAVANKLSNGLI